MSGIDNIAVMEGLKRRMQYLSERQAVLAQNVANADTPGYKSRDLKPVNFREEVDNAIGRITLASTNPGHISGSGKSTSRFALASESDDFETTPSGNAVVLEEEMLKMNKTATDYQTTTALYRKLSGLLDMAIDGGKR